MKRTVLFFWISTGLFSALMLMSAGMYFFNYDMVSGEFQKLGFPTYIIYPLAIAKILGVVAIVSRKSSMLSEWAYAGFFFDFLLALSAHLIAGDGEWQAATAALVLLIASRYFAYRAFRAGTAG